MWSPKKVTKPNVIVSGTRQEQQYFGYSILYVIMYSRLDIITTTNQYNYNSVQFVIENI